MAYGQLQSFFQFVLPCDGTISKVVALHDATANFDDFFDEFCHQKYAVTFRAEFQKRYKEGSEIRREQVV